MHFSLFLAYGKQTNAQMQLMQVAMQIANQMPIYQSQGMEIVMLCMCTHRIQLYSKSQSYVAVICPCHFETLTVLTRVHTQMLSE